MSVRLKARVVFEWEYDADPKHYGTEDTAEMIRIDKESITDDPTPFFDGVEPSEVLIEVVKTDA